MSRPGDWNCRACQHLNFQRREYCQRCGESRFGGRGGSSFGFTTGPNVRPGDWYCAVGNCGAHNFASRSSCFICGAFKDDSAGGFGGKGGSYLGFTTGSGFKTGDWLCKAINCGEHNYASRSSCFKCGAFKDDTTGNFVCDIPRSKAFGGNRSDLKSGGAFKDDSSKAFGGNRPDLKSGDRICTRKKFEEDWDDHDLDESLRIRQDVRQEADKLDVLGSNLDSAEDNEKRAEDLIPTSQTQMSSISEVNIRPDKIEGEIIPSKSGASIKIEEEQVDKDGGDTSASNTWFPCIFRTPLPKFQFFQAPELVSIGPYHSGNNLPLDKYKYSFLDKFLSRTRNQGKDLAFYVRQLMTLEWRARKCYSEDLSMASPDFVEMMLLDACVIIEVLRYFGKSDQELGHGGFLVPIEPWQIPILVRDLLILENQIPFFVLDKLFELSDIDGSEEGTATLITMALEFFNLAFPISLDFVSKFNHLELEVPKHLLDLFLQTIRPSNPSTNSLSLFSKTYQLIVSTVSDLGLINYRNRRNPVLVSGKADATGSKQEVSEPSTSKTAKLEKVHVHVLGSASELRKSGIRFMPRRSDRFTDIRFKNGVLEIPPITINDLFMAILINCVGFEHFCSGSGCSQDLTAYACFMSGLITSAADVECLSSDGIISSFSDQIEKVLSFFDDLRFKISGSDITLQDCCLSKTAMDINKTYSTFSGLGSYFLLQSMILLRAQAYNAVSGPSSTTPAPVTRSKRQTMAPKSTSALELE
ncbi:Zinc finger, RanBP2-type [Corchorus olitorius]|uniref:Zinc finger, RanBP2-type n=1 Tax=Corchorus olitorius TaxID=93759 RepID=A0A1R3I262_9ROSI|nr:Zinc finger, RanBP2-type [Corchorus olitorius]